MNLLGKKSAISDYTKAEKTQRLRVRRGIYILLGVVIHTAICFLIWTDGLLHVSGVGFFWTFLAIWAGYFVYFTLLATGINQRFKDPDLTMPFVIWAVTCIMYTVSLTTEIRALLLMFDLLVLVFSAFYLSKHQYVLITLYGIILYLGVILYLGNFHPQYINIKEEITVFLGFVCLSSALSIICYKISVLRSCLHRKNQKLRVAIKRVAALSVTDELTKVKNRRYILDVLYHQVLMTERGHYYFSVCMLDVDKFKEINDAHGHLIGDAVLKALCRKIIAGLREIDYFARIGGEEFLFVLPLVDLDQAKKMADRIRIQIANANFDEVMPHLKVTVSIGVTEYQRPEKIETTLARIDAALYAAKRSGRNQVAV